MPDTPVVRSYGCSFGCGNPYDYILISVQDSTTELLCFPCFVQLTADMLQAALSPDGKHVVEALQDAVQAERVAMNGNTVKPRGKNAPADTDDPDLIEAFDSLITPDELGPEFR